MIIVQGLLNGKLITGGYFSIVGGDVFASGGAVMSGIATNTVTTNNTSLVKVLCFGAAAFGVKSFIVATSGLVSSGTAFNEIVDITNTYNEFGSGGVYVYGPPTINANEHRQHGPYASEEEIIKCVEKKKMVNCRGAFVPTSASCTYTNISVICKPYPRTQKRQKSRLPTRFPQKF